MSNDGDKRPASPQPMDTTIGAADKPAAEELAVKEEPEQPKSTKSRSRSRDRKDRSRGKSRERSRDRDRDRDRDRHRKSGRRDRDDRDYSNRRRSRSRSRDRRRKSHSPSRDRRRRSRSRSKDRHSRRSTRRDRSRSRSRSRSTDEIGGYKPRKRQEPPKPQASIFATNDPFAHLRSQQPKDPAEAMRLWQEQMLKSRQLVLAAQAKSAVQQANKAQRELYIGNLTPGAITDVMLKQVFDSALIAAFPQAGIPGQEPVCRVNIHSDGRYGFIELRAPEYATAALQLNGQINLMGQALSIGRPASYVDPNKVNQAAAQAEAALAAFQQGAPPSGSNLATVAPVASLAAGSAGANMAAAANAAVAAALPGALAAGAYPGPPSLTTTVVTDPLLQLGGVLVNEIGMSRVPTPFLCVSGMITAEILENDDEYEEVM
eukprot:GHUV01008920.1.p1 GENE.GHUV01008920.1~~GHUV01008920.1.p1  ORF type:complete len:432 (+),score=109.65 GHUV01008920.1:221-1516(+)